MELLWEIAGWTGAAAILSAYLAVSMGWLKTGRTFQIANLLGACAFVLNGAVHQAWPSVAANAAWFMISAIALLRMRPARAVPVVPASILPTPFPDTRGTAARLSGAGISGEFVHDP